MARPAVSEIESEVGAMAADPEMRCELDAINAEFGAFESDGLKEH